MGHEGQRDALPGPTPIPESTSTNATRKLSPVREVGGVQAKSIDTSTRSFSTRVLLIDDRADDAAWIHECLRKPVKCIHLESLSDALQSLAAARFDLILASLTLPDCSGPDAVARLTAACPSCPVIALAPKRDDDLVVSAVRAGADDCLAKDETTAQGLQRSVTLAIERHKLRLAVQDAHREALETGVALRREIHARLNAEKRLRQTLAEYQAEIESKNQFVSNVSHELKTPLASISHAVENLLRGAAEPIGEVVREYMTLIDEECRRLDATITDILDLSRIEAGRFELNRGKLHFGRLVRHAVASLKLQLQERDHRYAIETLSRQSFVNGDPQRLTRVLLNLVGNAIKYTPRGGRIRIVVRVETEPHDVVVLDVIDDGVGIPAEHLPRVTERYYRVGEHVSGTGLGLALSKDIITLHGGSMELFSPPPGGTRGTQVTVRLPRVAPLRVMAVESDLKARMKLADTLAWNGCESVCLASAAEVVAKLQQMPPPDLLIFSDSLPDMDWFHFLAQLKSDPHVGDLPVIMFTHPGMAPDIAEVIDGFHIARVSLPWSDVQLIQCIDQLTIVRKPPATPSQAPA